MLCYCKKCGRIVLFILDNEKKICDCCGSEVYPVPEEFLLDEFGIKKELKQQFLEEYVKTSSEFDQNLYDKRDTILAQQNLEYDTKMAIGKAIVEEQSRVPKCPSCGSANVSKIGVVNRVVSTHLLGLGSSKIGKTHKCNRCGAMW